jgi:diguanylate cyclase (GGDEF)-like protein/PAS domain S-box-containing protein
MSAVSPPEPAGVSRRFELFSLRVWLPLALLIFTAIVLDYMYFAALDQNRLETESDMLREQVKLVSHVQTDLENFLRDQETEHVHAEFSALSADPEIRAALFADEHGKVVFASQMAWLGQDATAIAPYAEYAAASPAFARTWMSPDRELVLSVYPVTGTVKGDKLVLRRAGTLFIAADLSLPLAARNALTGSWMLKTGVLVGALALLVWLVLHVTVSRRVGHLLRAMGLVGERRVNVSSGVSGPDEIGQLGQAFDQMIGALVKSSERIRKLSQAVEQSAASVIITDREGIIEYVNAAFTVITGYPTEEVIGKSTNMLSAGQTSPQIYRDLWDTIKAGGTWRGEMLNRRRNGELYWDAVIINPVRDEGGEITHFVAVQEDITARKEAERQLLLSTHILNSVNQGVAVTDAGRNIRFINPAFTAITGYSAAEVIGRNPRLLHSGLMDEAFYQEMWRAINETGSWQGEIIDRRKNGESYPEWLSISTVRNEDGEVSHYVSVFTDISERKAAEERIIHMAKHDFLTGLPNRMLLQDRLAQAIFRAMRDGRKVAIMFLDLDRFKNINDTLGHFVGDKLLQEVASRIGSISRASDTVCRQGGDEFVIMFPDLESVDDIPAIADKLLETVAAPYLVAGNEIEVTTSIGISVCPDDGDDGNVLLQHADAAMYHAKGNGRNNYQFFTGDMNRRALERMSIEKKLRRALERGEFLLHYQPQVDLQTSSIIGAEALLRWNDPEAGLVAPDQFIPIAEETGLILPIGEWVLREACRQNSAWRGQGLPPITMAVNLSTVQFRQKDLDGMVLDILRESGLDPAGLELEITESAVMQNAETAILLLNKLKQLGVKLAMDDFGTGYSGLGYLKSLPIDRIKIDQSFVRDVTHDPDDAAIVRAIINLAYNLNLKLIAEGVETDLQLAFLMQYACKEGQGFYFSKPLPAEEFAAFFRSYPAA